MMIISICVQINFYYFFSLYPYHEDHRSQSSSLIWYHHTIPCHILWWRFSDQFSARRLLAWSFLVSQLGYSKGQGVFSFCMFLHYKNHEMIFTVFYKQVSKCTCPKQWLEKSQWSWCQKFNIVCTNEASKQ